MLAYVTADWLVAARAEPFQVLPPILKNDPKYSFQIYLTHRRMRVIPGGAVVTRMQLETCGTVGSKCRAPYKRPECGRSHLLALAMLTTPSLLLVAHYLRTRLTVDDGYLSQAFVTLTLPASICLYNLLARCSRTKTPFCLPVSFSADFNTRLSTRQYQCATSQSKLWPTYLRSLPVGLFGILSWNSSSTSHL